MKKTSDKKKPGRPRNPINTSTQEFHGIVPTATNPDNVLEFVYGNPMMLKKLFAMHKSFAVEEIEMILTSTHVQFISQDHLKKSKIFATIDGTCVNHYYCSEQKRIRIRLGNLIDIFGTITKSVNKVTFIIKKNIDRSSLFVILKDGTYDSEDTYEVALLVRPDHDIMEILNDDDYPLRFRMDAKHFKTKIASIEKLSNKLVIQKIHGHPLQLTYGAKEGLLNWTSTYENMAKLDLQINMRETDILHTSVIIDYIKPFTSSTIGEEVTIAVDYTRPISFLTHMDRRIDGTPTCTLRIFTAVSID